MTTKSTSLTFYFEVIFSSCYRENHRPHMASLVFKAHNTKPRLHSWSNCGLTSFRKVIFINQSWNFLTKHQGGNLGVGSAFFHREAICRIKLLPIFFPQEKIPPPNNLFFPYVGSSLVPFCFLHKPPILYYPLPDGVLNHLIEDDQNFTGIWLNFNTAKIGTPSVRVHFKVLLARPTCVSSSQNGMPSPHKYLPIPFFREICNRTSEVLKHSKHLCCFPQSPWIFYSRVLINLAFTKQKGTWHIISYSV